MAMLRDIDDYAGKYYSHEWIRRHVLHQSDEEMEEIDEQIADEVDNPQYAGPANEAENAPGDDSQQPPESYQPQEQAQ
jgi:hypothetical protein